MVNRARYLVPGLSVLCIVIAACSESPERLPTAPSSVSSEAASVQATGGVGNSATAAAVLVGWASVGDLDVEGEGIITAVSGSCPSPTITILGVPVLVTPGTDYAGGASCAGLVMGQKIEVRGVVTSTGGVLSVIATRIRFDDDDRELEGEGRVLSVSGTCPDLTITVDGGLTVLTNADTLFEPMSACALIAPGAKIKVRGTRTGDTITAATLELKENGRRRVDGEGTVASLNGTCPDLTMVVRGIRVMTNASTTYEAGECGSLRPGTKVRVDGETQADGSVLAMSILILDQPGGRPVEGEGTVASLHGTCPTLTMVVHGHPVMTTSATIFTGGSCADITPGRRIFARGTIEGNSVLAAEVRLLP